MSFFCLRKETMPSFSNYALFLYINLAFALQIAVMMYFRSADDIKKNWPLYRCNPPYWVFSDDISKDFTYCVQNTQTNLMGFLLQPLSYATSTLTNMTGELGSSLNNIRLMLTNIRDFVTNIVESIFGVFLNLVVEFQRMVISIKDTIGKLVGITMTVLYVLDGSIKTMNSAWSGPPGQMVKALGSCFHPATPILLANASTVQMQHLAVGSQLHDGSIVQAVMKLQPTEPLWKLPAENGLVLVTGSHFVWHETAYVQVRNHPEATMLNHDALPFYSCLITNTHRIAIDGVLFWDWEDDQLAAKK
jgi:hypothetical protein